VDAGFSSFGVNLTRCDPALGPEIASCLLEPVFALELGVVVELPRGGAEVSIAGLKKNGVDPDLVVLPGPAELGEEAWKLAGDVAPLIAPGGIGWVDDKETLAALPGTGETTAMFVRALVGGQRLDPHASAPGADPDQGRVEALAYLEASKVLKQLGGQGTAAWVEEGMRP
jgi:hypothetical protein